MKYVRVIVIHIKEPNFKDWIKSAESSGLHEFEACAKTYNAGLNIT
jgi:hypothetical protein